MNRERARIAAIREQLERQRTDFVLGIGDDAAILERSDGRQVLSVDVAVEDVHFRRRYMSFEDIGYRAFTAAASDLAAMGARGRASLSSLVLPADVDDDALVELNRGIADAADAAGAPVVGGNLSAGRELSITTTVIGEVDGQALTRNGARPGDGIYVTGRPGAAGLGLALLEAGWNPTQAGADTFCDAFLRPTAAMVTGQRLVGLATAAIDVSDGLMQDLAHICDASGVGADVWVDRLPLTPELAVWARSLDLDPVELVLSSGDDYVLLYTAPASRDASRLGERIGGVTEETGAVRIREADGSERELRRPGYGHF